MSGTKRPREQGTGDDSPTLATGVAAGGLGTAANLDDTQVMRTTGLAEPDPAVGPELEEPELVEPVAAPPNPSPAPSPMHPVVASRSPGPISHRARGLAGVLAAVFLVLAGVAILTTARDGTLGTGQSVPTVGPAVTAEPNADEQGKGKCNGKGKGNGNGNCGDRGGGDGGDD